MSSQANVETQHQDICQACWDRDGIDVPATTKRDLTDSCDACAVIWDATADECPSHALVSRDNCPKCNRGDR